MGKITKPVTLFALLLIAAFAAESALARGSRSGGGHAFSGGGARFGGAARFSGAPRAHFGGGRHYFGPSVGLGVVLAAPLFWPGYYYPGPYYDPFYYPYYNPPVVAAPAPGEYIEQGAAPAAPAQGMWYYCADPGGYYPYVQQCPGGWQTVPPSPPPPPR